MHLLKVWTSTHEELSERYRFIELVMNDKILVFRKTKDHILAQLKQHDFKPCYHENLLGVRISAFTTENLNALEARRKEYHDRIRKIKTQTNADLWLEDLKKDLKT